MRASVRSCTASTAKSRPASTTMPMAVTRSRIAAARRRSVFLDAPTRTSDPLDPMADESSTPPTRLVTTTTRNVAPRSLGTLPVASMPRRCAGPLGRHDDRLLPTGGSAPVRHARGPGPAPPRPDVIRRWVQEHGAGEPRAPSPRLRCCPGEERSMKTAVRRRPTRRQLEVLGPDIHTGPMNGAPRSWSATWSLRETLHQARLAVCFSRMAFSVARFTAY